MKQLLRIGAFIGLILITSCKASKYITEAPLTLKESVDVLRMADGSYLLKSNETGPFKVFKGTGSIKNIDWENPMELSLSAPLTIREAPGGVRQFFALVNEKGDTLLTSERQLPFKKVHNFRDLGGLPTQDGKHVRWGLLYRSDRLDKFSKEERQYLEQLNIAEITDLRFSVEVERHPDILPESAEYFHNPIGGDDGSEYLALRQSVFKKEIDGPQTQARFRELMVIFADSAAIYFKPILDRMLVDEPKPMLYHCSGGKDRTGYMTLVILSALGVDRETIRQDYLMSNYYRYKENKHKMRLGRILALDYETMYHTFVVQEYYLDAVYDIIDAAGGIDAYLEEKFGLDEERRAYLKARYTF